MSAAYEGYEQRVRERAHQIWLDEDKPEGRAEAHWALAREEIAVAENIELTLKPSLAVKPEPAAEPLAAVEGIADIPGRLSDQGDRPPYPTERKKPRKRDA